MKKDSDIKAGDFVTFHTAYGQRTGIVEQDVLDDGRHPNKGKVAVITVRSLSFKPKSYKRHLYKLKHAT